MDTIHYNNELNTIKYIALKNGYNPEMIHTILRKIKNKTQQNNTLDNNTQQPKKKRHKKCHINIL